MQKIISPITAVMAIALTVLVAVFVYQNAHQRSVPELSTPYHAVALTNGQEIASSRLQSKILRTKLLKL